MRDGRLLRSLWEPLLLSSLHCTSDMRQISTSVPEHSMLPWHSMVAVPCRVPLPCVDWTSSVFPRLRRTAQCNRLSSQELFFVQSQADPACSSSIILSLNSSQHLSILSSTWPPQPLCLHYRTSLLPIAFRVPGITSNRLLFQHAIPSSSSPNVSK